MNLIIDQINNQIIDQINGLCVSDPTGPSDAVTMVPVAQGWTSPWEPASSPSLPVLTFDPDRRTWDPWRVHLDLHRRCHPAFGLQREPRSCR